MLTHKIGILQISEQKAYTIQNNFTPSHSPEQEWIRQKELD